MNAYILWGAILIAFTLGGVAAFIFLSNINEEPVTSFEECITAGYPVMESHPRQCASPDGTTYTEDIPKDEEEVFCTMDAKLCPDGSYVGRIPPTCEFAPCPGE